MKQTQNERILKYLLAGQIISQVTCLFFDPPILRLASRINDLKKEGNKIITIETYRKDKTVSPVAGYVLKKHFNKKIHREFFEVEE